MVPAQQDILCISFSSLALLSSDDKDTTEDKRPFAEKILDTIHKAIGANTSTEIRGVLLCDWKSSSTVWWKLSRNFLCNYHSGSMVRTLQQEDLKFFAECPGEACCSQLWKILRSGTTKIVRSNDIKMSNHYQSHEHDDVEEQEEEKRLTRSERKRCRQIVQEAFGSCAAISVVASPSRKIEI